MTIDRTESDQDRRGEQAHRLGYLVGIQLAVHEDCRMTDEAEGHLDVAAKSLELALDVLTGRVTEARPPALTEPVMATGEALIDQLNVAAATYTNVLVQMSEPTEAEAVAFRIAEIAATALCAARRCAE